MRLKQYSTTAPKVQLTYMEAWKEARELRESTHPGDPDGGTFTWEGKPGTIFYTSSPTAHVKKYERKEIKAYWLREEISIADELLELAPKLTEEFLEYYKEFLDLSVPIKLKPYRNTEFDTSLVMSGLEAWRTEGIKYTCLLYTSDAADDIL
jgi:hypothetical protein